MSTTKTVEPTEDAPLLTGERDAALKTWLDEKRNEDENKWRGIPMYRWVLGAAYMLAMGVCGIVLVALGSTLDTIASKIGTTAVAVGSVFIARGCGAVAGAILSAKLYVWFYGNHVMIASLSGLTILLIWLPFVSDVYTLHVLFLLLGLGTAITDTGCQIMTRKVHGKEAGPWLGANTVSFGISGALVPLIEIITGSLIIQYSILAFVSLATAVVLYSAPNPEAMGKSKGPMMKKPPPQKPEHYRVEMILGFMVFWLIGGKVTSTAYFDEYVSNTGVIPYSQADWLILDLWIAITIGRLAGLQDQRTLTTPRLYSHLSIILVGGSFAMLLILAFPNLASALWIGAFFYGLFNGPCVGYCYDLNNRITVATESGMSIVMFGLNVGASLVPYLTALIWDYTGPQVLIVVVLLSMTIPLPMLHLTKLATYDPTVNPMKKGAYEAVSSAEDLPENSATV